ncbi:hypothetical protein D1007_10929 [Hordeum vulgare]|nr:hypothetical protein D1007_10929 [Hordeum vulgare]
MTTAPSNKGKPRAPRKTVASPKPKETLTPEQRARESTKRKGRRHAADARDEVIAGVAVAAAAQQEVTNACVAATTREMVLPDSPRASACTPMPDFHVYPQSSHLSGKCSPEVSMVAPSMPEIEAANAKTNAKEVALRA